MTDEEEAQCSLCLVQKSPRYAVYTGCTFILYSDDTSTTAQKLDRILHKASIHQRHVLAQLHYRHLWRVEQLHH